MATISKLTVIDIYTGVLGLLPPRSAITWLTAPEYLGKPLDDAANLVLDAFQDRYQRGIDDPSFLSSSSNENFVKAVYQRVFGLTAAELAGQSDGVAYWVRELGNPPSWYDTAHNNGRGSLISTMLDAVYRSEPYDRPADETLHQKALTLLANRETVADHYLQRSGADANQPWLREIINVVTINAQSVASAKKMIDAVVSGNLISGATGDETLNGTADDDYIAGYAGDDDLFGYNGNDALFGGPGNDRLYGGNGNDIVSGGPGNDEFWEDAGNDTYRFASGDGRDVIHDYGGRDIIEFTAGIAPDEVQVSRSGNHLVLSLKNSTDRIEITDHFQNRDYAIEEIHFADGTTWNSDTLLDIIGSNLE